MMLGVAGPIGAACDCSCGAYERLRSHLEEGAGMTPAIMTAARCAGECAQAWGQCRKSAEQAQEERRSAAAPEPSAPESLGAPREDLARFYGVYGDADNPGRDFFVKEAEVPEWQERLHIPPGYLMIGAMWGDVAPWYLRSEGDTRFAQALSGPGSGNEPIVLRFHVNAEGQADALTFESGPVDRGRLQRLGDLPERGR